jgi:hypothetical protein
LDKTKINIVEKVGDGGGVTCNVNQIEYNLSLKKISPNHTRQFISQPK